MQNCKYFYCPNDKKLPTCNHFYLAIDIFLRISLSYLQLLILFLTTKWSEKDVTLQIKSPEMYRQQQASKQTFQSCAKLFTSFCCVHFEFLLFTSYIFIRLELFYIRWIALLLHFLHHH